MSKARKAQAKDEKNIFLRGVYFRHYEDLIERTGDNSLAFYMADQAGRSGSNYVKRTDNVLRGLNALDLTDKSIREYASDLLGSFEKGIDKAIRRSTRKGEFSKFEEFNQMKAKINDAYALIDSFEVEREKYVLQLSQEEISRSERPVVHRISKLQAPSLEMPSKKITSPSKRYSLPKFMRIGLGVSFVAGMVGLATLLASGCKKNESKPIENPLQNQINQYIAEKDKLNQEVFFYSREYSNALEQLKSATNNLALISEEKSSLGTVAQKYLIENRELKEQNEIHILEKENAIIRSQIQLIENAKKNLETKVKSTRIEDGLKITTDTNVVTSVDLPLFKDYQFQNPDRDLELRLKTKLRDTIAVSRGEAVFQNTEYPKSNIDPKLTEKLRNTIAESRSTNTVQNNSSSNNLIKIVGADIDQYRVNALNESSRSSLKSLDNSGRELKETANSIVAVATLSYGNEKFKDLRQDDFSYKKPAKTLGKKFLRFLKRLDPFADKARYDGCNPFTGTITYVAGAVTGTLNSPYNAVNTLGAGLPNNVLEPIFTAAEEGMESGKHLLLSGANLTRVVAKPLPAKGEEFANKVFDWAINVPTEFASNVIEGEGFTNAENMKSSVSKKGNTGVIAEFIASGYLLGRSINDLLNEESAAGGGGRTGDPGVGNGNGGRVSGPGVR